MRGTNYECVQYAILFSLVLLQLFRPNHLNVVPVRYEPSSVPVMILAFVTHFRLQNVPQRTCRRHVLFCKATSDRCRVHEYQTKRVLCVSSHIFLSTSHIAFNARFVLRSYRVRLVLGAARYTGDTQYISRAVVVWGSNDAHRFNFNHKLIFWRHYITL